MVRISNLPLILAIASLEQQRRELDRRDKEAAEKVRAATKAVNFTHAADAAIQNGIQKHSVGDLYPIAVVAYSTSEGAIYYFIEDLQRGTVLTSDTGCPKTFAFVSNAVEQAEGVIKHPQGRTWATGRPTYTDGYWAVRPLSNPVQVVRLRSMLHRG